MHVFSGWILLVVSIQSSDKWGDTRHCFSGNVYAQFPIQVRMHVHPPEYNFQISRFFTFASLLSKLTTLHPQPFFLIITNHIYSSCVWRSINIHILFNSYTRFQLDIIQVHVTFVKRHDIHFSCLYHVFI